MSESEKPAVLDQDGTQSSESDASQAGREAGRIEDSPAEETPKPEAGAGDATPEGEGEGEGEPKREGGYKRKLRRAEQENARLLAQLERQTAGPPRRAEAGAAKEPADDPKPKLADYEDKPLDEYLEARDVWLARQVKREAAEEFENRAKAKSQEAAFEQARQDFFKREDAVAQAHEDYDDMAESASNLLSQAQTPTSGNIQHALITGEHGPELLYHFGQNPEEMERILALSPVLALVELGKLEARIASEESGAEPGKKPEPRVTKAPPPPTPLKKASPAGKVRPDDPASDKAMTDEEWLKARSAQVAERQRR